MKKQIKLIAAGVGSRFGVYASYARRHPDEVSFVGFADANEERLRLHAEEFSVPAENCFSDAKELFNAGIEADGAVICTMDSMHYENAMDAMKNGYDVLLEKPLALSEEHCLELRDTAIETGRKLMLCHVLRYSPFFTKIKDIIDSGIIGDICTVQAMERVEYWHMAHAFVRGNWGNSKRSCPMILAKSCHDTDALLWLCGKRCKRVSSFGSLKHFKAENQPEGASDRCLDCKYGDSCPYSAQNNYIKRVEEGYTGWPVDVVMRDATVEGITEVLKTSDYGKCVYKCDNDVVDHQVVNMWLEDDIAISFTMSSFNTKHGRTIRVLGTRGDIDADMSEAKIELSVFGKEKEVIDLSDSMSDSAHGGGDDRLFADFLSLLRGDATNSKSQTPISHTADGYLVCFAAEKSRLNGGAVVEL